MRLLDRYILKEFLAPFLFGMGAFIVILVGIQVAPFVLKLLVREHYPAGIVLRIFILRLPQVMAFTFPMATIFGSLMAMANMSSSGEVIAVRAGGVSLGRLASPVLVLGLLISLVNLGFNEVLLPISMDAAYRLQTEYATTGKPLQNMLFAIPSTGEPQRIVYARMYNPGRKTLEGLAIMELRNGDPWQTFRAAEAEWFGREWVLKSVEHTTFGADGSQRKAMLSRVTYDMGKTPAELAKRPKILDDMSIRELQRELEQRQKLGRPYLPDQRQVIQFINMHWALPWIPFGFALIGIPLGLRPVRATAGIGLGLSLVIAFAYYVLFNTLHLIGQQGTLPSVVAAWLPNLVLFGAGFVLFMNARR